MSPARRTPALLAALVLAGAALAGCSSDVGSSGEQGFVGGKGIITSLPAADRKAPGAVSGTSLDGSKPLALDDYEGKIVVVNVWGSWCGPCRAEAPMLSRVARHLAPKGVAFLGIDSRDPSKAAAQAFVRRFHISYPSIYDQTGRTLLAFHGTLTPNSVPSTIIIDKQGRVAGSVLGAISRDTLEGLVQDAGKTRMSGGSGA
ncbi:MAG: TlpA disulfide reductase family protein [Nocardioidaceae bacterium]